MELAVTNLCLCAEWTKSPSLDQTASIFWILVPKKKAVSPLDDNLRLSQMKSILFGGVRAVVK